MKNFICQACSNGCNISFDMIDRTKASISGYQCCKGVDYAERYLSQECQRAVSIDNKDKIQALPYSFETFSAIAGFWNIQLKGLHPKINILGSPERTRFRVIVEDQSGEFFKLEKNAEYRLVKKITVSKVMQFLSDKGMKTIQPYLKNTEGDFFTDYEDGYWQLAPFIKGHPLKRPDYVFDQWRGSELGEFLVDLRTKTQDIPFLNTDDVFHLPRYVDTLLESMKKRDPDVVTRIQPVIDFLEEDLFRNYDKLPTAFCHGDYHPLNMVWGERDLRLVIDWEFCGFKPEIYDAALLIGCLGIEDPTSLQGECVLEFLRTLEEARIISDISWQYCVECVVAQRFAWLSEWLRKKDYDMVDMETTYMKLIVDHADILKETWDKTRMGFVISD